MDTGNIIQLIAVIIALAGLIISNILLTRQMHAMKEQIASSETRREMDYNLALRSKALSYSLYSNMHLRDARLNIEDKCGDYIRERQIIPRSEIKEKLKEYPNLNSDITTLLAHWENLALAISSDIADEKVAKNMVAGALITHVIVFQSFIEDRRNINSRAYSHLVKLKDRWHAELESSGDEGDYGPVTGEKSTE